jgi:hypothetical protein
MQIDDKAVRLLTDYADFVRPEFERQQVSGVEALDAAAALVKAALDRSARLTVGFVGESQVGKSSIINALLDRRALPSGGLGPLTASATRVRYGQDPTIEIEYHGKRQIQQLAFVLEAHLMRTGHAIAEAERTAAPDGVDEDDAPPDPRSIEGTDEAARETRRKATVKTEYLIAQARTLLTGTDSNEGRSAELPERITLEALRAVIGYKVRCDPRELEPVRDRIADLRSRLGNSETLRQSNLRGAKAFQSALRLRAAGWLSPLVAKLDVALDAPVVQSLDITDLPGIGVVGDPAALVAQQFVTTADGALVLVMRNNGLADELASMLERTGVIRRLLFGGRDGRPPIRVVIAITRLDDVGRERHGAAAAEAVDEGRDPPNPDTLFAELAREMSAKVRSQLRSALRSSAAFEELPPEYRERREKVIEELVSSLHVECVAAPDYAALTFHRGVLQPVLLSTPEGTGIPSLRRQILAMATELESSRADAIRSAYTGFLELAHGQLESMEQLYGEGGGQAQVAWDRFRAEMQAFAQTLKPEVAAYQGEALAILRAEVPRRIELLCANAEKIALRRLNNLRTKGQALHYQSLNAALVRSGVWERQAIDYPDALTSSLVDAIATQWEPEVIEAVRRTLREWAERSVSVVERLVTEARARDARIATEAHVDAQEKLLLQRSRTAVAWTKERIEELRTEVQRELYAAVMKPIERACKDAVRTQKNRSAGAKQRILEAFHEGGTEAVGTGTARANELLAKSYRSLLGELTQGFLRENHDAVQAAVDSLTSEQLEKARRSDAQKRRHVLEFVAGARERIGRPEKN